LPVGDDSGGDDRSRGGDDAEDQRVAGGVAEVGVEAAVGDGPADQAARFSAL
jgi:hypothetical protein